MDATSKGRKILYSPGWGAGWVSWARGSVEFKRFMLTYEPLITALETGKGFDAALEQFERDAKEKYNEEPYLGGARDLEVATVHGRVQITEYDGNESYVEEGSDSVEWL